MRIIQIIDSLDVGGAEKMAVNYANSLDGRIEFSGLVVTRKEGDLKAQLGSHVPYLFLGRKKTLDFSALMRLKAWCKKEKVAIIHAHGTSYFFAFLLKLVYPKIKVIWHEHLGARSETSLNGNRLLWLCTKFFSGIIVVNQPLETWCQTVLGFKNTKLLHNFTVQKKEQLSTALKGNEGKRIVCLANLKHPKNHKSLIEVAIELKKMHPDWSFHLIGKDFSDAYSAEIKEQIRQHALEENVFLYGSRPDVLHILSQAAIAVLASSSEGLPVALIEYGLMKMPVVVTNVGQLPFVVQDGEDGFVVAVNEVGQFCDSLKKLIENEALRTKFGAALFEKINEQYAEDKVIATYLNWIEKL